MTTQFVLQSAVKFPVGLWINAPPYAYQSCRSIRPFEIYLYTEDKEPHTVQLYVQGSDSMPYQQPQNKWSHLNPQWRFTDLSGNVIKDSQLILDNATITTFNGTTGYLASSQFYFIDDMPNKNICEGSMLIWATVDYKDYAVYKDYSPNHNNVPGYANSKVVTVVPYMINALRPYYFNVDRDAINPMFDFYWSNTLIPHLISVIGGEVNTTCRPMIKHVPSSEVEYTSAGPLNRTISDISSSLLTWDPLQAYLSAYDYQNFNVGGYLRETVVSKTTATSATINVNGSFYYDNIPIHYPYFWISNPENNSMVRVYLPIVRDEWLSEEAPINLEYQDQIFDFTAHQVTHPPVMGLSGFHGVYGIALDRIKNVWLADAESDRVYKLDSEGMFLSSFNFGENNSYTFGITGGCTPAGISIDGLSGVWVTFFDSISVICLDQYTGELKTIINAGDPHIAPPAPYPDTQYLDSLYKPVLAEPDMNNYVWITYNNSLCCSLAKYTNNGVYISSIALPLCSNPMDIHFDLKNNVWVSLGTHSGPPYLGSVRCYDTTNGSLISSISAYQPSYIAIGPDETLWFTQSGNTLTRVLTSGNLTNYQVGSSVIEPYALDQFNPPNKLFLDSALEGLSVDLCNRLHVINSVENILYTLSANTIVSAVKIKPDYNLSWYNDVQFFEAQYGGPQSFIYTLTAETYKSAQAFGDWSGYKWVKKYQNPKLKSLANLSGSSKKFDIYDFTGYDVRRFNESWDATNNIKSYTKQEHILNNPTFWDKYMASLWGTEESFPGENFGKDAYEKIANFAANHIDIDTCNINQLYSLANFTDVPIDVYGVEFPPQLRRIMDIVSINQQLLWGSRCNCNNNLTNTYSTYTSGNKKVEINTICDACGHSHPGNKGEIFSPLSYIVTAGVPFIVENRSSSKNRFQLITPPLSCKSNFSNPLVGDFCITVSNSTVCLSTYPLSATYNVLLPPVYDYDKVANYEDFQQAITYFCFYKYVDVRCNKQIAGVINWDDPYTSLQETASSVNNWYANGQTVERMINYALHKGLGLIVEE